MVKFSAAGTGETSRIENWRKRERTSSPIIYSLGSIPTSSYSRPRFDPDVDGEPDEENYWVEGISREVREESVCTDAFEQQNIDRWRKDVVLDHDKELPQDGGALTLTFSDPEVLDCPICLESLTIPVYQCENGHTACSACCPRLGHKCPSCSLPIGYNRCRAMEKVIESVRIPCSNKERGCNHNVLYSQKHEHTKTCVYAACSCPVRGCCFSGSYKQTYQHAKMKHAGSFVYFNFDNGFNVFFNTNDKLVILQEEEQGVLFLLKIEFEGPGSIITISRLGPSCLKERNYFDLSAETENCNLRLRSFANLVANRHDFSGGLFLMIPLDMVDPCRPMCLNLTIWRDGKLPPDMRRTHSLLPDQLASSST